MKSALYRGSVMHRRLQPRRHHFLYRAFWLLIDLDELPMLSQRLSFFSHNRANLFSLRDRDHGDGSDTPLRRQAEQRLAEAGIDLGSGRITLFCMPRTIGYSFNPLSIYFCHDARGRLAALIYQVHNTFGERHSYVMQVTASEARQQCRKAFYVSPFLHMDMTYEFRLSEQEHRLTVGITARNSKGEPEIVAVLSGDREPFTDRTLMRFALSMPAIGIKVIAAIHWEALRLFLKGVRLVPRQPCAVLPVPRIPD